MSTVNQVFRAYEAVYRQWPSSLCRYICRYISRYLCWPDNDRGTVAAVAWANESLSYEVSEGNVLCTQRHRPRPAHPPPPLHSELIPITIIKLRRGETLWHRGACVPPPGHLIYINSCQQRSPALIHPPLKQQQVIKWEIGRVQGKYWILTQHCIFVSHPPAISSSLLCAVSKLKIRTTNRRNALQHIMRYERSAVWQLVLKN